MGKRIKATVVQLIKFLSLLGVFFVVGVIIFSFVTQIYKTFPHTYKIISVIVFGLIALIVILPIRINWKKIGGDFLRSFRRKVKKTNLRFPQAKPENINALLFSYLLVFGASFLALILFIIVYIDLLDYLTKSEDQLLSWFMVIFSTSMAIRISLNHLYPSFDFGTLLRRIRNFAKERKIPLVAVVTATILIIISGIVVREFLLSGQSSSISWKPDNYQSNISYSSLTVQGFHPDKNIISGEFFLSTFDPDNIKTLEENDYIIFEDQKIGILGNANSSSARSDVDVKISGSDYYFPFNKYTGNLYFYPETGFFRNQFEFVILTDLPSVKLKMDETYPGMVIPYFFILEYSSYYKLLVIAVGIAFIGFLVAILGAPSWNLVVELTVGVFAALIAIRGFLIPENLSSPLFLDQLFALYIIFLFIAFLFKYIQSQGVSE